MFDTDCTVTNRSSENELRIQNEDPKISFTNRVGGVEEKKQGSENGVLRRVTVHRQVKLTYRSAIRENRQTKREHDGKEQE